MTAPGSDLREAQFSVPDMMCEGCAERMQAILGAIEGVRQVKPSVWRKRVRVRFEPARVEISRLMKALESGGFEASEIVK